MLNATIQYNALVATGIYELSLLFDGGVRDFQPGQFAHIRLPGDGLMLLRRPISVNHIDMGEGSASFVYQVKGGGTKLLAGLSPGERLDVLAPLGRGFWKPEGMKRAALLGGGIGAAPLRMLAEMWPDVEFDAFLGFRGEKYSYHIKEFSAICKAVHLCSDDGSLCKKALVTGLLAECLKNKQFDAVFACGPAPMLKALKAVIHGTGIPCQVSLEERMGCGFGACLVCSCKIRHGDEWHYRRVCKDGPVFDLAEVEFDGQP